LGERGTLEHDDDALADRDVRPLAANESLPGGSSDAKRLGRSQRVFVVRSRAPGDCKERRSERDEQ
jgi:hypothetical protein